MLQIQFGHMVRLLMALIVLAGLVWLSQTNYLLFHSLVELGAIAVAWGLLLLIWGARHLKVSNTMVLLALAYGSVGGLDLLHTLAYAGMGVFPHDGANLATQLWLAARFLETFALVAFPFLLVVSIPLWSGVVVLSAVTLALLAMIFWWDVFPLCFVDGYGLTPFKIVSEYLIIALLLLAAGALYGFRRHLSNRCYTLLIGSFFLTIASEFSFTLYNDPYAFANMTGHLLKMASFYLLYRALIVEGLENPFEILAHKVAEQSSQLYRQEDLLRQVSDAIITTDTELLVTSWNIAAQRIYGWNSSEAVGRPIDSLLHTEWIEQPQSEARKILLKNGRWKGTVRQYDKKGNPLLIEAAVGWLCSADGKYLGGVTVNRDNTQRFLAQQALAESEARFNAIVNDQTDLVCRFLEDGCLTFVNQAYAQYFGRQREELTGMNFLDLVPPESRDFVQQKYRQLNQSKPIATYEHEVLDHQGQRRWMEWTDRAIFNSQGEIVEYQAVGRDVSDRKILERNLMDASDHEQARLAQELHDGLCQDLKSLEIHLTILENELRKDSSPYAARLDESGQMANQALNTAYLMARGMLPAGLDIASFPPALLALVDQIPHPPDCRIESNIQTDLFPPSQIHAIHLYRIAREALTNAVHHSHADQIVLAWQRHDSILQLSIIDNGCGLDTARLETNQSGLGISVMRGRAGTLGAEFSIQPGKHNGTEVLVRIKK